jgi:hypothetical protein
MLRRRDVIIELTTPVALRGETMRIDALAEGAASDGSLIEARAVVNLPLLNAEEAAALRVDESIVGRATERLQAKADMDASVAAEAGDYLTARRVATEARDSAIKLSRDYGTAVADRAQVDTTVDYLDALTDRLEGPEDPGMIKARYAAASMSTRGRGRMLGTCPECGEKAFFEVDLGGRVGRTCNACGHTERP